MTKVPLHRFANDRLLRSKWKAGTAPFHYDAQREERTPDVEVLSIGREHIKVPPDIAGFIGFTGEVLARKRRYLADGIPMQLAQSYIPWLIAEGTPMVDENPGPGGIYARLEEAGHRLWRFRELVTVYLPDATIARLLALDGGQPVMRVLRVAHDTSGMAVEICDTVMAADRYTLVYEMSPDGLPGDNYDEGPQI